MSLKQIRSKLKECIQPEKAQFYPRFFKTGPGEYGEGDIFLGVTVPDLRRLAKKYKDLSIDDSLTLLRSQYHEERLLSLFILIHKFEKGTETEKNQLYKLYLDNTAHINNWDLVDASAYKICGPYLYKKNRKVLYQLVKSDDLWERRISIMTTYYFIKNHDYDDTLALAEILLQDDHDLIHKAVGWMLRELGKRDIDLECAFLDKHTAQMPRTMLRYAIEKFPEKMRKEYLMR